MSRSAVASGTTVDFEGIAQRFRARIATPSPLALAPVAQLESFLHTHHAVGTHALNSPRRLASYCISLLDEGVGGTYEALDRLARAILMPRDAFVAAWQPSNSARENAEAVALIVGVGWWVALQRARDLAVAPPLSAEEFVNETLDEATSRGWKVHETNVIAGSTPQVLLEAWSGAGAGNRSGVRSVVSQRPTFEEASADIARKIRVEIDAMEGF